MSHRMTPRSRRYRNGEDATVERTTVVRPVGGEFEIATGDYLTLPDNTIFHIGEPRVTYTVRFCDLPHDQQVALAKRVVKSKTRHRWRKDHYEEEEVEREAERYYPEQMRAYAEGNKNNQYGFFVTHTGDVVSAHRDGYQEGEVLTYLQGFSFDPLGFAVRKFNGKTPKRLTRSVQSGALLAKIAEVRVSTHHLEVLPEGQASYWAEPSLADYGWENIQNAIGSDNDYAYSVSGTQDFSGDYYALWNRGIYMVNPCEFDLTRPSKVVYASLTHEKNPSGRAENPRGLRLRRPR